MSAASLRACVLQAADALESARDELCRLDSAAGDGDHGVTMALAARAVRKALEEAPDASGGALVTRVAMAMGSVGGASGPIYAGGLLAIATAMRADGDAPPTAGRLAAYGAAAQDAIMALGHAKPGDKTILDALHPAVEALRAAERDGAPPSAALAQAAAAAREGATATARMTANVGRASRLGERSRGLADPGATSLAIILEAEAAAFSR